MICTLQVAGRGVEAEKVVILELSVEVSPIRQ
jgi:hypothetical protein